MTTYISPSLVIYNSSNSSWSSDPNAVPNWATSVEAALSGCGLVQTSDTGQTAGSAMTYTGTVGDWSQWQIWRFNDSRQGVDPVFLRLEFGRPAQAGDWTLRVTVGQGTDGAGNLTGQTAGPWIIGDLASNSSTGTATTQHYCCHTEGYLVVMLNIGHANMANYTHGMMALSRMKDTNGNFDGKGLICYRQSSTASENIMTSVRWDGAGFNGSRGGNTHFCIVPGTPSDTGAANGGNKRLYPHWYYDPTIRQAWAHFTVRVNEISNVPQTFTATPYANGGTHTFICMGLGATNTTLTIDGLLIADNNWIGCVLWE